jgi:hypothetical protein
MRPRAARAWLAERFSIRVDSVTTPYQEGLIRESWSVLGAPIIRGSFNQDRKEFWFAKEAI